MDGDDDKCKRESEHPGRENEILKTEDGNEEIQAKRYHGNGKDRRR